MRQLVFWMVCGFVAGLAPSSIISAAELQYPTRPIRLIVAAAPGGPNDLVARMAATPWGDALGRPIVVDNRAGATGMIGTEIAARAAPDGYTLLMGFPGPLIIAPMLSDKPPYDALRDFAPISLAVSSPFVLLVIPSLPARTMKEFVALAKTQPGKINYASGGAGQSSHMAMELFKLVAGMDVTHVPYKGAGPGMTAMVAGEVGAMFAAIPAAAPHIKANRLRALAVGGGQRSPLLPETPTISESGFQFDAASWYGMLAPRNTPRTIVAKLNETLVQTLTAPAMRARLTEIAFEVNASSTRRVRGSPAPGDHDLEQGRRRGRTERAGDRSLLLSVYLEKQLVHVKSVHFPIASLADDLLANLAQLRLHRRRIERADADQHLLPRRQGFQRGIFEDVENLGTVQFRRFGHLGRCQQIVDHLHDPVVEVPVRVAEIAERLLEERVVAHINRDQPASIHGLHEPRVALVARRVCRADDGAVFVPNHDQRPAGRLHGHQPLRDLPPRQVVHGRDDALHEILPVEQGFERLVGEEAGERIPQPSLPFPSHLRRVLLLRIG